MKFTRRSQSRSAIAIAVVLSCIPVVRADSLVTRNGEIYIGTITKTATGYTVQAAGVAPVQIAAVDVKRVLLDHSDSSAPPDEGTGSIVPAPVVNSGKGDPKAVKKLIEQGTTAYVSGSFTDARDAFTDALAIDPANVTAGRGLGFSYLRLNNSIKAAKPLEVAAAAAPVLDRPLTIAIASSLLASHTPMRAVKYIKSYFESHPTLPDEQLLNAFGSALSVVDASASRSDLFKDATKLYLKLNTDLEATQPGKKRWGIIWLDAADVDQKLTDRKKAQKDADASLVKLQGINSHLASVKTERANAGLATRYTSERTATIHRLDREISDVEADQAKAQAESDQLSEALLHVPKQEFPQTIETDDVDLPMQTSTPTLAVDAGKSQSPSLAGSKTVAGKVPVLSGATEASPTPAKPAVAAQHVTRYAVAFAIAPDLFVTASDVVADATAIHAETSAGASLNAEIVRTNRGMGLALLRVKDAGSPCLAAAPVMTHSAIKAWGYPEVSMFNAVPQEMACGASTPGPAAWTIRFPVSPRLPGGPVLQEGLLVGVELTTRDTDPMSVPGVTLADLKKFIGDDAKPGTPAADPKSAIVQVVAEQ